MHVQFLEFVHPW